MKNSIYSITEPIQTEPTGIVSTNIQYFTSPDTSGYHTTAGAIYNYTSKQTDAIEEYKNMDIDHLNQHDKMNYEKALNDLFYAKDTMDELLGRVPVDDDTQATQKGKKIKFKFKRK